VFEARDLLVARLREDPQATTEGDGR
jgi:hypothetical protein